MNFKEHSKGFATNAIHAGQEPEQWSHMAVVPPIVMSSTFKQFGPADFKEFVYGRYGNPTRNVLEKCLAKLDGAKHGLAFSSGLGAITSVLQMLTSGDHVLSADNVYGGTHRLFSTVLCRFGLDVEMIDLTNVEKFEKSIRPSTRMVWLESPSNPLLNIIDIGAISKIAHQHPNIIVVVDNSFLSSYLQRPLELGADVVVYSLSKYMNGHSDVVMGSAATNCDDLHERLRFLQKSTGMIPSPFDCYQVNRSLKTLALRMERHSASSLVIAKYLETHPQVEKVIHPGLPSHPQHELALRQMSGHSGMISFYLKGGLEQSKVFLQSLLLFAVAESLGGYESLAELPSIMTHASIPADQRAQLGITDNLIRLSVGLEDVDDLIEDLEIGFRKSKFQE